MTTDHTADLAVIADVADAIDPALPKAVRDAAKRRALDANPDLAADYAIAMLRAVLSGVDGWLERWFEDPQVAAHWMRHIRGRGGRVEFVDEAAS